LCRGEWKVAKKNKQRGGGMLEGKMRGESGEMQGKIRGGLESKRGTQRKE